MSTRAPKIGTVVWGILLLVVAGVGYLTSQYGFAATTPAQFVWIIVAIGGVIVLAGIAGAIVQLSRRGSAPPSDEPPA